jgi:hypothetical protein
MNYNNAKNIYSLEPSNDNRNRIEIEIGDSKQNEFLPQVKIQRWNNEVNFSARLKHKESEFELVEEGKKIKLKGSKVEAHFYEKENAFEFEAVLKEKPDTNIVEFTLNTKGIRFSYQPELTEDEIKEGIIRPENVIGSYAVFSIDEKINIESEKIYGSGKVGHIYRPEIIDSAGNKIWGKLNINNDILSIEIPQDYLDKAIYPVFVDPTFGYTSAGGSASGYVANWGMVSKGTPAGGNGYVTKLSAYIGIKTGGGSNGKAVIWLNSDGTIISNGVGGTTIPISGAPSWYDLTYSSYPNIIDGTAYLVGCVANGGNTNWYFDNDDPNGGYGDNNSYSTPVTLVLDDTSRKHSIYATYTVGSPPAGPANLKTYNTNPKANIKTIDTNPIANVKTLNTNP